MKYKKILQKLLYLPLWVLILLTVVSAAALTAVFLKGNESHPMAIAAYVLSAYTLGVWCIFLIAVLPDKYRRAKERFAAHPYGQKYLTDVGYKVRVSLYISLAFNLLYAAFKLVAGVLYASSWWMAMAVYYILLSTIRFVLLRYMRSDGQNTLEDWKRYRFSGVLLLMIHLCLTGMVVQMLLRDHTARYPEVMIITIATYTFYTVVSAIKDIAIYRKYHNPAYSAAKMVRLASALVSLLTMEAAMLSRYGEDESFRQLMIALTGGGICATVLTMSLYMVIKGNKEVQKARSKHNGA